jgi:hypothetical protein
VDDQPDVAVDAHRPEVLVLRPVQLVELHPRVGGVELEVEGRGLHGLLLFAGQLGEAVGEGVGDAELHMELRPPGVLVYEHMLEHEAAQAQREVVSSVVPVQRDPGEIRKTHLSIRDWREPDEHMTDTAANLRVEIAHSQEGTERGLDDTVLDRVVEHLIELAPGPAGRYEPGTAGTQCVEPASYSGDLFRHLRVLPFQPPCEEPRRDSAQDVPQQVSRSGEPIRSAAYATEFLHVAPGVTEQEVDVPDGDRH